MSAPPRVREARFVLVPVALSAGSISAASVVLLDNGDTRMFSLSRRLWQDDHGFLVSSELVLIATVGVLGLLAGLTCVRDAVVCELKDVAGSIGSLNQSYCVSGFRSFKGNCGVKAWTAGSSFFDCEEGVITAPAFDCVPHVYEAVPNPPPCVEQPLPPVLPAPPPCPPVMLPPPELPPCVDVPLCPPVAPAISPCPCPAAPAECCPAASIPCDGVLTPVCPVPGHPCFPPQPLVW
jgi:hypothetical protein